MNAAIDDLIEEFGMTALFAVVLCNSWGHGWFASHTIIALDGGYIAGVAAGIFLEFLFAELGRVR